MPTPGSKQRLSPVRGRVDQAHRILSDLEPRVRSDEEAKFVDFAHAAVDLGKTARLHLCGLSQPDILYYMPAEMFVPGSDWPTLQEQYENTRQLRSQGGHENMKEWLLREHQSKVTANTMRKAAETLDHIPDDLVRLLDRALNISSGKKEFGSE